MCESKEVKREETFLLLLFHYVASSSPSSLSFESLETAKKVTPFCTACVNCKRESELLH